jgi:enoyl-CoA hydratase/carnithine racemase
VEAARLQADAEALVQRQVRLAPQAARAHKRLFRALNSPLAQVDIAQAAHNSIALCGPDAFAYADSPEHREGIGAFLQKRPPMF